MAFQMDFNDNAGVMHTSSHWRVVQINISASDRNINLVFYGYASLSAFGSGKYPLPGAHKQYSISGNDFFAIAMSAPVGTIIYDVLAHASETYAIGNHDVDTGAKDVNGNPIMVSFFNEATQV